MALRLTQLRYLVTVAEEGQMTRAARTLHLAQPALSQAISQLEAELGIELLKRHARGVTLTPAGETFLAKARIALAATTDAALTAQSLARAATGAIEVGFIGPPPMLNAPELFMVFAETYPDARISFRGLPFPVGSTASWLEHVDVAFCHSPAKDREVLEQVLRSEPRVVLAPDDHPLAQRSELSLADVLDETFISYHPTVQRVWAGFHSLDDHRGRPAPRVTDDNVLTPLDILAAMASRHGITVLPGCDAELIQKGLPGLVAIPLRDASPAMLALVWRKDTHSPLVSALVALARGKAGACAGPGAGKESSSELDFA